MCDYSLEQVMSRPARVGDQLVTTRFEQSITRGFAAADAPDVAVCLLPGTELAFEQDAGFDHFLAFFSNRRVGATVARFRKVETDKAHVHHDALEFANGKVVLLTQLTEGQRATVLQLPATASPTPEGKTVDLVRRKDEYVLPR